MTKIMVTLRINYSKGKEKKANQLGKKKSLALHEE